ncbi:MAG: triose-phosphate isomerase [Bacteroidales bacterium]|nr:triose-phosphate isomerase [Bacteroidales bacterium]
MKRALYITISLVAQWLLAATFLFSGFVKAADPMGMEHKIEAYLQVVSDYLPWVSSHMLAGTIYLDVAVVALAALEFLLGVYFLLGIHQRLSTVIGTAFMTVMTLITVYIYLYSPVPDCGCFGDAITLTNGQTLAKNVVLLACVVGLLWRHNYMVRFVTRAGEWVPTNSSFIYIVALTLYSLWHLPLVDFTGYRVGTNIMEAMMGEYATREVYGPDGVTVESVESEMVKAPTIDEFSMTLGDTLDLADEILADSSYTFILTLPRFVTADKGCSDQLNDVYDFVQDNHLKMYCATAMTPEEQDLWSDRTGAAYPFATATAEMLEAMVRSNPGLLLIHNGEIVGKWGHHGMPLEEELTLKALDKKSEEAKNVSTNRIYVFLSLLYVALLTFVVLVTNLRRGIRMRKAAILKQKRKSIFINPIKHKTTMRKHIVAGNWKMNKNLQEGVALATELKEILAAEAPNCEVVIGTPFIHLATVSELLKDSCIAVSAENCANKEKGAYTGEVSAEMVKSTGAEYVILGHSERREYYAETPEILKEKVDLALANGLKVIFCIGESLEEREANKQEEVCKAELAGSVFHLTAEQWKNIVIAYEPIWAIGTGKTATAEQAEEIHAYIRSCVAEVYGAELADETSILYGGSCKGSNAPELFAKADIDGGLIGGASLKAADFKAIIDAWK